MNDSEYWLIAVPGEPTKEESYDKVQRSVDGVASVTKFSIPDIKFGTLDNLMALSDELLKLDGYSESVTRKMFQYTHEVLEHNKDKVTENLMVDGKDMKTYLQNFTWEYAKLPIKQFLKNIVTILSKIVSSIESELKNRSQNYNNLKSNLQNLERKQVGSLMTRNLADLVRKDHFIIGSEYLITLLVVVPRALFNDWDIKYEKLCDYIVPRSSQLVFEDQEHGLYTVTLFRRTVDSFKLHARENKFLVREFEYDEQEMHKGKQQMKVLELDKRRQFGPLVRWLKVNYSEAFIAWTHVKALRVFVESVLRYGLPVNFIAMLIKPNKSNQFKKIRDILGLMFFHLDSSFAVGTIDDDDRLMGMTQDYYPYVYCSINTDLYDSSRR